MNELITFGESMALMMPTTTKGIEYSPQMSVSFGGAESNVAIGLARLGHKVGWFGRLGQDPLGSLIVKRIRGEGVDVSRAELTPEAPTGLMFREQVAGKSSVYYYRKGSAASKMQPSHLDEQYIASAKYLHVTGITAALSDSSLETLKAAVAMAKRNGVKVCFDPNLRLKLWTAEQARPVLLDLARQADIFLPGLDELKILFETSSDDEALKQVEGLGDGIKVVKGGNNATLLYENGAWTEIPYVKVEHVVDTVGAGDAFCSGFYSGLIRGYSLTESVRLGNVMGAMIIQTEGDWEGAPTWQQVQNVLEGKAHVER
ncbi:sugar kinase [Paenibacillus turpanensis]|uniref:sugar kinase n=1 Tax=Paenibacillus turpanensis TaxID=2689078 RepID=UPI00140D1480|nr:sugar kinase [Paenibacillus turpanensis]